MRLRIKYCGGCNAAFDRVKFVKKLIEKLETNMPGKWEITFDSESAQQGILVCGCSALCAVRGLNSPNPSTWHIIGPDLLNYRTLASEQIISAVVRDLKETS